MNKTFSFFIFLLINFSLIFTSNAANKILQKVDDNLIKIDGFIDDWMGIPEITKEAGKVGRGKSQGLDVKEVYMAHDGRNLYLFLKTKPGIAEVLNGKRTNMVIAEFYINNDNNRNTGSKSARIFGLGKVSGLEKKIVIGFNKVKNKAQMYYTIYNADKRIFSLHKTITSSKKTPYINYDIDGVEMVISFQKLGITKDFTMNLIFSEKANALSRDKKGHLVWALDVAGVKKNLKAIKKTNKTKKSKKSKTTHSKAAYKLSSAMLIILLIGGAIFFILTAVVSWNVYEKTGQPGAMGLLMVVPGVNLIMLILLAFNKWPIQKKLEKLQHTLDDYNSHLEDDEYEEEYEERHPTHSKRKSIKRRR